MDQNPYESPRDAGRARMPVKRWLVWSGLVCIAIALVCLAATVFGMMGTFNDVAASGASQSAQEVARGISNALIPAMVAMPVGIVGAILLIVAALMRRTRD